MSTNMNPKLPRGLRNNNPLNLRRTKTVWTGQKTSDLRDPAFCEFDTMAHGWRAAFKLLSKYYYDLHLTSIDAIINRWAPPADRNNTAAYVSRVAELMRHSPLADIGLRSDHPGRWMMLASAMAIVENGTASLDYFAMLRGYEMAFCQWSK